MNLKKRIGWVLLLLLFVGGIFGLSLGGAKAADEAERITIYKGKSLTKKNVGLGMTWAAYKDNDNYMNFTMAGAKTVARENAVFCIQPEKEYPSGDALALDEKPIHLTDDKPLSQDLTAEQIRQLNYLVMNFQRQKPEIIKSDALYDQYAATQCAVFTVLHPKSEDASVIYVQDLIARAKLFPTASEYLNAYTLQIVPNTQEFTADGADYTATYQISAGLDEARLFQGNDAVAGLTAAEKADVVASVKEMYGFDNTAMNMAADKFVVSVGGKTLSEAQCSLVGKQLTVSLPGDTVQKLLADDPAATTITIDINYQGQIASTFNMTFVVKPENTSLQRMILPRAYTLKTDDEKTAQAKGFLKVNTGKITATKAANAAGADISLLADNPLAITDRVTYEGLQPGETYTLHSQLMVGPKTGETEGGKELIIDGKTVESEQTFTPAAAAGQITATLNFNGSRLGATNVVVFETIMQGDTVIAAHKDYTDADQTVRIVKNPRIETDAFSSVPGEQTVVPQVQVDITDRISYLDLNRDEAYELETSFRDAKTGEKLVILNNAGELTDTIKQAFTPEKTNGTWDLSFTIDAQLLGSKQIVVFETLYKNGQEVASHQDLSDSRQTITVKPYAGVTLHKTDVDTGQGLSGAEFKIAKDPEGSDFISADILKVGDGSVGSGIYTAVVDTGGERRFLADKTKAAAKGELIVNNLDPGIYYFVETKAPPGYQLSAKPLKFEIRADQTAKDNTVSFTNISKGLLPNTGSAGQGMMLAGGGLLVVIAAICIRMAGKKDGEQI